MSPSSPSIFPLFLFLFLLLPLLLLFSPFPSQTSLSPTYRSKTCPQILPPHPPSPRIINGDPSPSSLSALTLLLRSPLSPTTNSHNVCTAVRISPSWALTAAHCYVNTSWSAQSPLSPVSILLSQVIPHPNYILPTDRRYDIALLLLDDPPAYPFPHLHLNANPLLPIDGAFVRVIGYGKTSNNQSSSPSSALPTLHHVDIPVVPFRVCKSRYVAISNTGLLDPSRQLCAGYLLAGGCDSCVGDSGGPLFQYDPQQNPVLVALVSAGKDCAMPYFPGINLRVDAFITWMRQHGAQFAESTDAVQLTLGDGFVPQVPPERNVTISPSVSPASPLPFPVVVAPSAEQTHADASQGVVPSRSPSPVVAEMSVMPSAWAASVTPTVAATSGGVVASSSVAPSDVPVQTGGGGDGMGGMASATPKTPLEEVEENGDGDDGSDGEVAIVDASVTPGVQGGGERGLEASSVGEGARLAGIVAGAVGGVALVAGLVILAVKKR